MFENFHNKKLKQKKHSKFIWVSELSDQVLLKVIYQHEGKKRSLPDLDRLFIALGSVKYEDYRDLLIINYSKKLHFPIVLEPC